MIQPAVKIALLITVVYCSICLWMFIKQDKLIFQPSKWESSFPYPNIANAGFKEGFLCSGKEKICFWYLKNPNAEFTILFFHGNAGNLLDRAEIINTLYKFGLSVFIIDYRGYGKSSGRPDEYGLYEDAKSVYNYLIENLKINPNRIIIFGNSLGGAVAIDLVSSKNIIKGKLIVEASFTSLKDISKILYPLLPVKLILKYKFDSLEKIKNIRIPIMFAYSQEDELIPLSMGKTLSENCPSGNKHLIILKKGSHNDTFLKDSETFLNNLAKFTK